MPQHDATVLKDLDTYSAADNWETVATLTDTREAGPQQAAGSIAIYVDTVTFFSAYVHKSGFFRLDWRKQNVDVPTVRKVVQGTCIVPHPNETLASAVCRRRYSTWPRTEWMTKAW
jgi:hypothetical protein